MDGECLTNTLEHNVQFGAGPSKIAKMLGVSKDEGRYYWETYHKTYGGVVKFGEKALVFAEANGYLELGLGLRLQTPLLTKEAKAGVRALRATYDQEFFEMQRNIKAGKPAIEPSVNLKELEAAEGRLGASERSAVNALTQFWDYLTIDGLRKFQKLVEAEGMDDKVVVHATIYDSLYFAISEDVETIDWVNRNLIKCMCEDFMDNQPVKLVANVDISTCWGGMIELPNNCSREIIEETLGTLSAS
jgi:DNA polymerase I-like protein with 3'-5' exonuclease and polymerase domains